MQFCEDKGSEFVLLWREYSNVLATETRRIKT